MSSPHTKDSKETLRYQEEANKKSSSRHFEKYNQDRKYTSTTGSNTGIIFISMPSWPNNSSINDESTLLILLNFIISDNINLKA